MKITVKAANYVGVTVFKLDEESDTVINQLVRKSPAHTRILSPMKLLVFEILTPAKIKSMTEGYDLVLVGSK